MTAQEFAHQIKLIVGRRRKPLHIRYALCVAGFERIGDGATKRAFRHWYGSRWVVKVFHDPADWRHDASTCGHIPPELRPFWLPNTFACTRYVIQPFAGTRKDDRRRIARRIDSALGGDARSRFDIYTGNVGRYKGKPVVIDFVDFRQRPENRRPSTKITF